MKRKEKYRLIFMNIFVALAIGVLFNLASFVFLFSDHGEEGPPPAKRERVEMLSEPPGELVRNPGPGGYRNPPPRNFHLIEFGYLALLAFVLLSVSTSNIPSKNNTRQFIKKILLCMAITMLFFYFAPKTGRGGNIVLNISSRRFLDPVIMLKTSSVLAVTLLYGKVYELIYQKQKVVVENEKLKNENLQTSLNSLVSQINPHFFFNSLNSLSMLVREKHNDKAITYIDRLSETFRYIINNGNSGITVLEEELQFMESSIYLLNIRYEGKIFFDISVDDKYRNWKIPSFSIQPLIENAVKHNSITNATPLRISVKTRDGAIEVTNTVLPKSFKNESTGIGLRNLSERYSLLTGETISIESDGKIFRVVLPLTEPLES